MQNAIDMDTVNTTKRMISIQITIFIDTSNIHFQCGLISGILSIIANGYWYDQFGINELKIINYARK